MDVEEFRSNARASLEQTLNHLQAATLLVAELEVQIAEAGRTVQLLSQMIEAFADQRQGDGTPASQNVSENSPTPPHEVDEGSNE